jgi:hypothetical protein
MTFAEFVHFIHDVMYWDRLNDRHIEVYVKFFGPVIATTRALYKTPAKGLLWKDHKLVLAGTEKGDPESSVITIAGI